MLKKILKFAWNSLRVANSGLFSAKYYLENNPDLNGRVKSPFFHFMRRGWREGRRERGGGARDLTCGSERASPREPEIDQHRLVAARAPHHPHPGARRDEQPRHAARGRPAAACEVVKTLRKPTLDRHRRAAHLPRPLR